MSDLRLILAAEADQLPNETGFIKMPHAELIDATKECGLWFGPRDTLEGFDAYRQLIPYVVVVHDGKILTYTRTPKGGEVRLHGKVSFGLGGHIDLVDAATANDKFDLSGTLFTAACRELEEELGIGHMTSIDMEFVGLLTNLEDEVGRVHQGVVAVLHLDELPTRAAEDAIGEVSLKSIEELATLTERMESWSAILVPYLPELVA